METPPTNSSEPIRVLSLFSGAGGLDLGLEAAGMEIIALCEIEAKARAVLRHHWPDTPIYNDVKEVTRERLTADGLPTPHIVAGGSPCQDLSIAGRRTGLSGGRSGLFWEQTRIADEYKADIIWENVAGALSSSEGADFAAVLWGITGALPELPPKGKWSKSGVVVGPKRVALWRILDAQRFGVPQRRRRVYVIGCSREVAPWFAALLFEFEGSSGDSEAGFSKGEGTAGTVEEFVESAGGGASGDGSGESLTFVKVIRSGARDTEGNLPPEVWREEDTHPTVNTFDMGDSRTAVLAVQDPRAFSGSHGGETSEAATLLAHGVRLDWSSETFIMQEPMSFFALQPDDQQSGKGALRAVTTDVAPTIGRGDHHSDRGLRIVQVASDTEVALPALVRMREGKPGGGKGPLISSQVSLTIATGNDQVLFVEQSLNNEATSPSI